jgi:hypothetical protein
MFLALGCGADGTASCEPRPLPRSLNTVDPSTHDEPYQHRMPKTSGRPLYDAAVGSGEAPP